MQLFALRKSLKTLIFFPLKNGLKLLIEWSMALTGIAGVAWIALNIPTSRYGWVLALAAPVMFVTVAVKQRIWPLAVNQALLAVITMVGIWRWVL